MTETAPRPESSIASTPALLLAYQQSVALVREQVARFIEDLWRGLGAWREADIARFVSRVVPVVEAAQRQVSTLTNTYLASERSQALGTPVRPATVDYRKVTGAETRGGTAPAAVYRRAGEQVWRDLAEDKALEVAVEAGLRRAVSAAMTDIQLTKTRTAQAVLSGDSRVVGYRRVLNGERNCALCVVASTQRYRKEQLMPLHPQCDCSVSAIYGESDPGQVIDEETLIAAHDAIKRTFGLSDAGARKPDYRKLLLVYDHGEYGPTLSVAGHTHTTREALRSKLDLSTVPKLS